MPAHGSNKYQADQVILQCTYIFEIMKKNYINGLSETRRIPWILHSQQKMYIVIGSSNRATTEVIIPVSTVNLMSLSVLLLVWLNAALDPARVNAPSQKASVR